jgi:hypothetical protein
VSDNPFSAGNQQERLPEEEAKRWFVAGLVEGEGSVTVSIKRHPTAALGYLVQPELFVYQHRRRRGLLELVQEVFGGGTIRAKPGNPDVLVLGITSRPLLCQHVVPFLLEYMRYSARSCDFLVFVGIVGLMERGAHRDPHGLAQIVELAYGMNFGGKQRRRSKDEIIGRILRGHTPDAPPGRRDGPTSVATRRARRNRNDLAAQVSLGSNTSA